MHNLRKIKLFRALLYVTYVPSVIFLYIPAMLKRKNKGKFFFFLDRYVIGGAQRVHLDMLESIKNEHKQLYFTRLSPNSGMKEDFFNQPYTEPKDIHFFCDNLLFRLFTVHFYAFYVNRHKGAYVFSSNSTFFYDMLPFLSKEVTKTELLHNFTYGNNGMEFFGLANYQRLDHRIVIDAATKENIINQYKEYHIPSEYSERITLIEPGVPIPAMPQKNYELPLKILYAGRGTPQKRIYLLNRIAEHCIDSQLPVEFHFAGTMMNELSDLVKSNSVIHGEVSGQAAMYELYKQCHAIMMTSAYEGFPMLIKESMACGCIPIVTALEGNKTHMKHGENSLLMFTPEDEGGVVKQGIEHVNYLLADKQNVITLCAQSYTYAQEHFDKNVFISKSRSFLTGE